MDSYNIQMLLKFNAAIQYLCSISYVLNIVKHCDKYKQWCKDLQLEMNI